MGMTRGPGTLRVLGVGVEELVLTPFVLAWIPAMMGNPRGTWMPRLGWVAEAWVPSPYPLLFTASVDVGPTPSDQHLRVFAPGFLGPTGAHFAAQNSRVEVPGN